MLTERLVRDAKPEPKTRILWDSRVRGLGVRITPSGVKAFILNYRVAGRERRATLGRHPAMSLHAARDRAGVELAGIRAGETDPLARQREAREAPTVADGLDRFFDVFAPQRLAIGRLAPKTVEEYGYAARRYLRPALGQRKVADVTRQHVERMIEPLPRVQRNRVLALTSRLFRLFESWEWRPQHSNPVRGIERAREEARDRVLTPSELAALGVALREMYEQYPAAVTAIRFAAVTGLRIGEVLAIQWGHVDFESGRLTLPETKTGRRVHHLPAAALDILASVPRLNDWAFTTGRPAPITYRTAHVRFRQAAEAAGLPDVRLHDLRRTVMTAAAASGIGTHVLRDLLGHRTTAMVDRYIRAVGNPVRDAREQVGSAMAAWMAGNADRRESDTRSRSA